MVQLIARIPLHQLPTQQMYLIAVAIECAGEIRWRIVVVHDQAAVAVGRHRPAAGERLFAQMAQFQQVVAGVVVVFLAVIDQGARVVGGAVDLAASGADQAVAAVVGVGADGVDALVFEKVVVLDRSSICSGLPTGS